MKRLTAIVLTIVLLISMINVIAFAADGDEITLGLSVYEQANGKYLAWTPELTVPAESSVLNVLEAAGLSVAMTGDEISSVGGISNGDYGENSRWTFTVNGVATNIAAAKYIASNGDKIALVYTVPQPQSTATAAVTQPQSQSVTAQPTVNTTRATATSTQPTASTSTAAADTTAAITQPYSKTQPTTVQSTAVSQNSVISSALSFAKSNKTDFTPLVLSCYSQAIDSTITNGIISAAEKAETLTPPELSTLIINAAAIGYSPSNINGADLSKQLLNQQNIMKSGLYGAIYRKFALEHCKSDDGDALETAKDDMTALILQNQNDDGSFSPTFGERPDVSLTALSLAALSDSTKNTDVSSAVDKSLLWLINAQNKDGSFSNANGTPDCAATANVIIALRSLGINITDERFVREQNTYDALLKFYNGTAFSSRYDGKSDANATEAALLAMFSYNHSSNPYTLQINSHLDKLNIWLFGIIAAVLLIALGTALIVMKKKGFFANAANSPDKSSKNIANTGEDKPNV